MRSDTRFVPFLDVREAFATYVRWHSSAGERGSEGVVLVLAPKTEQAIGRPECISTAIVSCSLKASTAVETP